MYKAVIIWETGEKEEYFYNTYEEARNCVDGYKMAFGNQIQWVDAFKAC